MPYTTGPQPSRLQREVDVRTLGSAAYTLVAQTSLRQEAVNLGHHHGMVTSVAVLHRMVLERRSSVVDGIPRRWYSVVTTAKGVPNGIATVQGAMERHRALNASNRERWLETATSSDRTRSFTIDGDAVDFLLERSAGLLIAGIDRPMQWLTIVVPEAWERDVELDLVRLW